MVRRIGVGTNLVGEFDRRRHIDIYFSEIPEINLLLEEIEDIYFDQITPYRLNSISESYTSQDYSIISTRSREARKAYNKQFEEMINSMKTSIEYLIKFKDIITKKLEILLYEILVTVSSEIYSYQSSGYTYRSETGNNIILNSFCFRREKFISLIIRIKELKFLFNQSFSDHRAIFLEDQRVEMQNMIKLINEER